MIAVVAEPGMPRVNKGTNEPVEAALFAVSGAASPLKLPFPNCNFCLADARFLSMP